MAAGTQSDFQIYHEQLNGGLVEALRQNTDAFNAAANGTIRLTSRRHRGDYSQESFFQYISGIVQHRDTTSIADVTDLPITQDEFVAVKLNRRIGPIAQTLDSFKKIARELSGENGDETVSVLLGEMIAKDLQAEWLNTGLEAYVSATLNQAAVTVTDTAATITTTDLVDMLNTFGDSAAQVRMWVMHSKVFYDLVKDQITTTVIDGVSNVAVAQATPVTLGRPVLVTDSSALIQEGSPDGIDGYYTLGLTPGAIVLEDSEERTFDSQIQQGKANLIVRLQGEIAYTLSLKGYKWDVANGGANPLNGALYLGSNWDKVVTSDKDLAGCIITTN